MCKEAVEVQNQYPRKGDWFLRGSFGDEPQLWIGDSDGIVNYKEMADIVTSDRRVHTWLPKQDQLCEILQEINDQAGNDLMIFFSKLTWCFQKSHLDAPRFSDQFNSVEKLWLAIIMKEKYNKRWRIDKWVI